MERVSLALIASGSGTDAKSIMQAWKLGCVPEVEKIILISTREGAGCLEKAMALEVQSYVADQAKLKTVTERTQEFKKIFEAQKIDLIFLVGCVIKMFDYNIPMYNIHPADPKKHGGDGMYGLKVHERVLREIMELHERGRIRPDDTFYSYPTVHEAVWEYDAGSILLQGQIQIPTELIQKLLTAQIPLELAAKWLQALVLPNEWIMLPAAVRMAAKIIIKEPLNV